MVSAPLGQGLEGLQGSGQESGAGEMNLDEHVQARRRTVASLISLIIEMFYSILFSPRGCCVAFFFSFFLSFLPLCQISGLPSDVVDIKCGASFCVALTSKVSYSRFVGCSIYTYIKRAQLYTGSCPFSCSNTPNSWLLRRTRTSRR